MKQCPKCNCSCEDSDIICRNCGFLFGPGDVPAGGAAPEAQTPPPAADASGSGQAANGPAPQTPPAYDTQTPPAPGGTDAGRGANASAQQAPPPYNTQTPPPYAGQSPYNAYGYPQQTPGGEQKNDGYAIASLVLGLVGAICCQSILIPSILAVIFGFVSKNRISLSKGGLKGDGMAIAGIILGFVGIVFFVIFVARFSAYGFDFTRMMQSVENQ